MTESLLRISLGDRLGKASAEMGYVGRIRDVTQGRAPEDCHQMDIVIPIGADRHAEVALAPGDYMVEALTPAGELLEQRVTLTEGESVDQILLGGGAAAGADPSLNWQLASGNIDRVTLAAESRHLDLIDQFARNLANTIHAPSWLVRLLMYGGLVSMIPVGVTFFYEKVEPQLPESIRNAPAPSISISSPKNLPAPEALRPESTVEYSAPGSGASGIENAIAEIEPLAVPVAGSDPEDGVAAEGPRAGPPTERRLRNIRAVRRAARAGRLEAPGAGGAGAPAVGGEAAPISQVPPPPLEHIGGAAPEARPLDSAEVVRDGPKVAGPRIPTVGSHAKAQAAPEAGNAAAGSVQPPGDRGRKTASAMTFLSRHLWVWLLWAIPMLSLGAAYIFRRREKAAALADWQRPVSAPVSAPVSEPEPDAVPASALTNEGGAEPVGDMLGATAVAATMAAAPEAVAEAAAAPGATALQATLFRLPDAAAAWRMVEAADEGAASFQAVLDGIAARTELSAVPDSDNIFSMFEIRPDMLATGGASNDGPLFAFIPSAGCPGEVITLPLPWPLPDGKTAAFEIAASNNETSSFSTSSTVKDPNMASLLGYMSTGRLRLAALLVGDAQALLNHKFMNPMAAALGAYVLLATSDEVEGQAEWRPWIETLYREYPRFADGAILQGWNILQRQQNEADLTLACNCFVEAVGRGVPIFIEGVKLLQSGLAMFGHLAAEQPAVGAAIAKADLVARRCNPSQAFTQIRVRA